MARSHTTPSARLKVLLRAKERANKARRGELLSAKPMSKMLEVAWPTLRDWCNDLPGMAESGVFVRGGQGDTYEFKPRQTVAFLIKHFEKQQKEDAAKTRRQRQLLGGSDLAGVPDDYSLDELDKSIRIRSRIREERMQDGRLTDAERAQHAVREMFSKMQQAGTRAAQQQDPTGRWPVEIRESFEDAISSVMHAMEVAARDCLRDLRSGAA